jgi:predicted alpha/beta superfamily hydrolase
MRKDRVSTTPAGNHPGYADSGKTYSILYTTDGDLIFGAITQIARLVALGKTLLQLVIAHL